MEDGGGEGEVRGGEEAGEEREEEGEEEEEEEGEEEEEKEEEEEEEEEEGKEEEEERGREAGPRRHREAPSTARVLARSLPRMPACPLTWRKQTGWARELRSSSSRHHRSRFSLRLLAPVAPAMSHLESVRISRGVPDETDCKVRMAAKASARLLVKAPASRDSGKGSERLRASPSANHTPMPAARVRGSGLLLLEQAPSV